MDQWIAGRFGRESGPTRNIDASLMGRTGAALYAAGATLALVWLALPHPTTANDLMLVAVAAAAYAGAGMMWFLGERLSRPAFEVFVAAGIVLVSLAVYSSGRSGT